MSRISHQIIRDGANRWIVWRIEDRESYEQIARIVCEGGLYYVETPQWLEEGAKWERQPRGWTLKEGAVRSVTNQRKELAS